MKKYSKKFLLSSFIIVICLFAFSTLAVADRDFNGANRDFEVYDYLGGLVVEPPNEVIVKYKKDIQFEQIEGLAQSLGISQVEAMQYSGVYVYPITQVGQTAGGLAASFSQDDIVEYAEPNYFYYALRGCDDPYYSYQWHMYNQNYGGINMENAWDIQTGNTDVIVAVIDTGVAYEDYETFTQAPDLANTGFVPGYDFVGKDDHPNDDHYHGTHVAGTIAQSTNNNLGGVGVAPDISIMPIKVLDTNGSGTSVNVAEGIYFAADNGADVINLSLGSPSLSITIKEACEYAYNMGVTIVAASGNDGIGQVSYPAANDDYVIAVGATRYDEARAPYSNYGTSLDIMGPGGDTSVDQNNDGYGDGVLQNTINPMTKDPTDLGYWFLQGTSMATPHVAGVAALLIAQGAQGPDNIRNILQTTAEDLGSEGWDEEFGHGLVDAHAALLAVPPSTQQPPIADAAGPYSGTEGEAISLDGSGSSDPDGTIVSYNWDFGDGATGTGVSPTHTYTQAGNYTVTLTVTDNDALEGTDTANVIIGPPSGKVTMHVDDISFDTSVRKKNYSITGTVRIVDSAGEAVHKATVDVEWSGGHTEIMDGTTDKKGNVKFKITGESFEGTKTFTLTVIDVNKSGMQYEPSANTETSDSVTIP